MTIYNNLDNSDNCFCHFDNWKDNPGDLWHLRHWLQFWQLRTWIHDSFCYLTINCDTGQHSQYLRCFFSEFYSSILAALNKLNCTNGNIGGKILLTALPSQYLSLTNTEWQTNPNKNLMMRREGLSKTLLLTMGFSGDLSNWPEKMP